MSVNLNYVAWENSLKGRTIRKPIGGKGGVGRAKYKKIFAQGKIKWKKNSCTAINPKKYSCYGLKFSYKEFDNEKKFMRLDNSPPPNQWSGTAETISKW